jgi:hypothetical protein
MIPKEVNGTPSFQYQLDKQYGHHIQFCLKLLDPMSGGILHFPFNGSAMEQPFYTLTFLWLVQEVFISQLNKTKK